MRDYRCGSIWIVSFDPSIGTEIRKTRPALIISPTDFNQVRSKVTLLPISSTAVKAKKILPVIVRVKASQDNGLQSDSTIIAIEPSTFDKRRLVKYLGQLEENCFGEVKSILKSYLDL
ncbi:MAG: type II toxin-antitoxin system PemK/MazF family toxin [Pleurocapsa minor HA4230-MV1]|nr:type II toxin-antitoxin system PemK/MazF family toxin [Pleurocapsa minor HA4230-MV1]